MMDELDEGKDKNLHFRSGETLYSKSSRIRTYFFESQAEIGSYFKGTKIISRYRGSYLKGASCSSLESLTKMFSPIICVGSILVDLISN